jgi:hypothetical protein
VRERARSRVLICGLLPWWGRGTGEGGDGSKTKRARDAGRGKSYGRAKGQKRRGRRNNSATQLSFSLRATVLMSYTFFFDNRIPGIILLYGTRSCARDEHYNSII